MTNLNSNTNTSLVTFTVLHAQNINIGKADAPKWTRKIIALLDDDVFCFFINESFPLGQSFDEKNKTFALKLSTVMKMQDVNIKGAWLKN